MPVTKEQIPTDLTLEIGADLSPERFMTAARAFFGYIQELSESFAPEGDLPTWVVKVREGSTLLAVDPTPKVPPEVLNIILNRAETGIDALARGDVETAALPEPAMKHLRTLAEMAEGTRGRVEAVPMRLWVRKKPISVEPIIASVIREEWRADFSDYGTIEGRLETIQESHGGLQFLIRDVMLRQKVRCYFPEKLLSDVFDRFRKRVEVSGVIHYRKNGMPVSIRAETLIALPDDSELPTVGDVRGILRN
jgi:hypothetical protein